MADPLVDGFLAYIARRGIPEKFHNLYRDELLGVLLHAGVTGVQHLSSEHLAASVRAAERQLQNRKAVVAALDEFLRTLRQQSAPPLPAPDHREAPSSARGSSAFPPPGAAENRRYVRVPFNREVQVSGSVVPIRASDLSLGGMYLETRQVLEAGEIIDLAFRLRANDAMPIRLRGQVVYLDPGVGVGIDFLDAPAESQRAIRHFIEDMIAGRQF
jgi:hypothetical protein